MQMNLKTAQIIMSTLPYIQKFRGEIFVIKYGGAAQIDENLKRDFAKDIALLQIVGIKVIVVHGGGKDINKMLENLSIKTEFKDGIRVTSKSSLDIVEMVLKGQVNSDIVALLNETKAKSIGLSGVDANFIEAIPFKDGEFGFVGEIKNIKNEVINKFLDNDFIPVIAPIGVDESSQRYNINADICAAKIAKSLKAKKIIFLTDTAGVLDKDKNLISKLDENLIENLIANQTITGGMIPKIQSCLDCVKNGVDAAHIIDGRVAHSILLELFTDDGIGSVIR